MNNAIKITLSAIAAIYLVVNININFGKNKWQDVLESDAWGYYAYLPAVFIYNDLNFKFYDEVMHHGYFEERLAYDYRVGNNGKVANKYFCGTALVVAPFFYGAHILSGIQGVPQDGYNRTYILSVTIAAIFYTILGLFFLAKLLQLYSAKVSDVIVVVTAIAFGTQVFYYSFGEPGMSHVYSFCFVNLFLWKIKEWFNINQHGRKNQDLLIAAFSLGIIFLIRPFNVLIILIVPFLSGNGTVLKNGWLRFINSWKLMIVCGLIFICTAAIQLIIYWKQTGSLWIDSYPGENFNFLKPHFYEVLFSFKKGLFIYTPLVFLAHGALFYLYKHNMFITISYLLFFSMLTYILSCWWIWYYGGSFSMRPYIEYFGVFAVLLLLLLQNVKNKSSVIIAIVLLVVLCQIQTYQYRYFVIHWSEMNQSKYIDSLKHILYL